LRSFDVFDTIIARRYYNNEVLLQQLEEKYTIPNFSKERKRSDTGTRSYDQIYDDLVSRGILNSQIASEIKLEELALERKNSFLITENLCKIQDGDVFISDMYLSGPDILDWTRFLGMNKQVTIYQSNSDKSTGKIWEKLRGMNFEYHIGDNEHSDVNVPRSFGINPIHYQKSSSKTEREVTLQEQNLFYISCLIREVRLTSDKNLIPYSYEMNIPWLLLSCEILYRKYSKEKLVFLGRDCQLLYKIYSAYYGPCYYLPFSRKAAFDNRDLSLQYLQTQAPKNCQLIDIASTGKTWEVMCEKHPLKITALFYSSNYSYAKKKPVLPKTFDYIVDTKRELNVDLSLSVEYFNCGDHGYLSSIKSHNDVIFAEFGELAFSEMLLKKIQEPALIAAKLSSHHPHIRNELHNLSDIDLQNLFNKYSIEILSLKVKLLEEFLEYNEKEKNYLREVATNVQNY